VTSVGAPLSSGDLLARLREKRLAASGGPPLQVQGAGPGDSGQPLSWGTEPVRAAGGVGAASGVSMPDVETEVAKMLDSAGERGLSSMDLVRQLAAALGPAGHDIAAMHRALDRVGMRRGAQGGLTMCGGSGDRSNVQCRSRTAESRVYGALLQPMQVLLSEGQVQHVRGS